MQTLTHVLKINSLEKVKILGQKILQLANKRRKIHNDLQLQTDEAVLSTQATSQHTAAELTAPPTPSSTSYSVAEINDFFQNGPGFSLLELKRDIEKWQESSARIDQLHNQDLLYCNILYFATIKTDAAIEFLLKDKYTAVMEHLKGYYQHHEDLKEEVNTLISMDDDDFQKLSKGVVKFGK